MASNLLKACGGVALLAAVSAAPAQAQFSWDPVDEVLGTIGITAKERPHIDYRERAPLVVPRNGANLPAPQDKAAIRGQRWPNDPDVAARRRAAEEARAPNANIDKSDLVRDATGRNRYAGVPSAPAGGGDGAYNPARAISREQVRELNAAAAVEENAKAYASGEPRRETLTDPPKGYRAAQGGRPIRTTMEPMRTDDSLQINILQPRN